ncbi:MAG: hypothetical protein LBS49_03740 [Candidatus Accumulibacter sp.]|nr:hypothetical protein [Accumulibacter sp.]
MAQMIASLRPIPCNGNFPELARIQRTTADEKRPEALDFTEVYGLYRMVLKVDRAQDGNRTRTP